jgi:hypothetical protein
MAKGGDEAAREKHGATPVDIAQRCGHTQCVVIMGGSVVGMENGENARNDDSDKYGQRPETTRNSTSQRGGGRMLSSSSETFGETPPGMVSKVSKQKVLTRTSSVRAAARRASIRKLTEGAYRETNVSPSSSPSSSVLRGAGLRISGDNVTALFDFNAESSSEISLKAGDKYVVLKKESSSGWTYGQNDRGEKGLFPTQYVQSC